MAGAAGSPADVGGGHCVQSQVALTGRRGGRAEGEPWREPDERPRGWKQQVGVPGGRKLTRSEAAESRR